MKDYSVSGKLSLSQIKGRIPIPKKGSVMKVKKGKGSYRRKDKHKKSYCLSFLCFDYILFDTYPLRNVN